MKNAFTVIIVSLLLILSASFFVLPANSSATSTASSNIDTAWVTAGTFLNYSVNGNVAFSLKLSNGSSESFSAQLSGTYQFTVDSVQNGNATITTTPNLSFSETTTFLNGTAKSKPPSLLTSANATTTTKPLSSLHFSDVSSDFLSHYNSTFFFSPHFNASAQVSPGVIYSYKSSNVLALHISASLSAATSLSSGSGAGSSYSVNGTFDYYRAMAHDIPLELAIKAQGSASIASGILLGGTSASGSVQLTIQLNDTNVNLGPSSGQQGTVNIPAFSASLNVVSNSTIQGVGTSGNKLVVNVTGPSGTTGILNVVMTQKVLEDAGITNTSQIGVTLDGQAYNNYSVTQIGGAYIFTIYYHHSSHTMALSMGNANLGTNTGTVSQITAAGGFFGLSDSALEIIAAVVVIIIILGAVFATRRSKTSSLGPIGSPRASPLS